VESLKRVLPAKMGAERIRREYDLRAMNRVSENEYQSRMSVWDALQSPYASDAKVFIDNVYNELQQKSEAANRNISISYAEFVEFASEEINYIKVHAADKVTQYFWYATIAFMLVGIIALCR